MTADSDGDRTHHHELGEDAHHGEGNHEDEDICREVGGDNPHEKEDTHDEVDIRQRGGDTRDEKSDQARYVDETRHESRSRTREWGDMDMGDDAAEGKSAQVLVRQRDTHGDIYARGQKTLVHRE